MRRAIFWCLVAASSVFAACKSEHSAGGADAAGDSVATSTLTRAQTFDALAGNLLIKLQHEAKNRPADTPKIEDVVAALRAKGLKVRDPEQGLGATIRARYCAVAMMESGLGFSMCEFGDEKSMAIGREIAEKQYHFAGRSFYTRKTTLLGMRPVKETDETKKDAAALVEAFEKL